MGYAIPHIPVSVLSQDKFGGLWQKGIRRKNGGGDSHEMYQVSLMFHFFCQMKMIFAPLLIKHKKLFYEVQQAHSAVK